MAWVFCTSPVMVFDIKKCDYSYDLHSLKEH